ncbi:hypothetical protein GZH47_08165 [Paenibacillus rhizovicinus]|uniref:Uncharacterized protein n=1 Tax=Paenibacillus rhizovicinus TaxID=2704463 RepID=A0A6C0NXC0_9BACL|nr:hypothetical protein [Paenibacillus rhizovicinus]QHW30828.1 hypothetical protein GZH47_08165 [Paenibacillus rhizovicinus]
MKRIGKLGIPGFRTGRLWKKIAACAGYAVLLFAAMALILGSQDSSASSADNRISMWENISILLFVIILPFALITNVGKIRSKLPLFRSSRTGLKITGWIAAVLVLFVGMLVSSSVLSSRHTAAYTAMQLQQSEEQAIAEAKERTAKEADNRVKLAKEAEAKAKKEAEHQAVLAKQAEEKAAKASEDKAKKEAEEQVKLAKAEAKKAQQEADNQAKLAQAEAKEAQQEIDKPAAEEVKSADGDKQSTGSKLASWFGGLLGRSDSNAADANEKLIKSFDSNLKKRNTEKLISIYQSSDAQMKAYMEERVNEAYLGDLRDNIAIFEGKKTSKITKLYKDMAFIDAMPGMKQSDVGIILADMKNIMDKDTALASFNKEHPRLNYGIIKDLSQVQDLDVYVNSKIQNGIGNVTISYSDNYFISSYSYDQFFGYSPSDDWEAVLQLSSGTRLSQAGVYKTQAVPSDTITLTDNKGFEKDYTVYREVFQADFDKYNQVSDLMAQQAQLSQSVDNSIGRITKRLA